ncbi:MAG: alpha/beta fold hydrolase [bacterium]
MTIWTDLTGIEFAIGYVDAAAVATRSLRTGRPTGRDNRENVVFLHGTSGHLEAFSRNIAPHAERYRCHAIDMLGHGYTGKPPYRYEIPRYAEHLLAYLDAVGIERAHLVGESLGGWVAGWLASEHPERVQSLQLVAAGGTKADPAVMQRIRESTTAAVTSGDIALTRQRLELLMRDPVNVTDELVQVRHAIYQQPTFQENLPNLLCLQDLEVRTRNLMTPERLGRISAPTLVVWGRQNPFGEVPEAHLMAESVPGATLELFDECGHWPQHEQPEKYNELSLNFLGQNPA